MQASLSPPEFFTSQKPILSYLLLDLRENCPLDLTCVPESPSVSYQPEKYIASVKFRKIEAPIVFIS